MKTHSKYIDIGYWVIAILLVGAGVVANTYYSAEPLALRLIGWIILAAVVFGLLALTTQGVTFRGFAKEAQVELRKVVWPTRQETLRATGIVVLMVLLVSLILWGLDSLLFWLIGLVAR